MSEFEVVDGEVMATVEVPVADKQTEPTLEAVAVEVSTLVQDEVANTMDPAPVEPSVVEVEPTV